mmetsp:Transcript_100825/g.280863  ORF Transcript_100825/g.280863 Transcript_100825/m.280863 type:complete len:191 (+) Transcript_100825:1-573(+)
MPHVRMVVQLRDPIERALSRWKEQHGWAKLVPTYDSFQEYIDRELPQLQACLEKADEVLEARVNCASLATILGQSLYDSALKLWHRHFAPSDLLVTYLEQLAVEPEAVLGNIHSHLGIRSYAYDPSLLHAHYNTQSGYGWGKLQALLQNNVSAMEKLYMFYRPQMVELKAMADAGLVGALPAAWVARWRL